MKNEAPSITNNNATNNSNNNSSHNTTMAHSQTHSQKQSSTRTSVYEKTDKTTFKFLNYPYCVFLNKYPSREQIHQKLEIYFEIKKVPRLFKTMIINDSLEVMFQLKEHANEFIDLLELEMKKNTSYENLTVKLVDGTKRSSQKSSDNLTNLINLANSHVILPEVEKLEHINNITYNNHHQNKNIKSNLRKNTSMSDIQEDNEYLNSQHNKNMKRVQSVNVLKSPSKTIISSVINNLYGSYENKNVKYKYNYIRKV